MKRIKLAFGLPLVCLFTLSISAQSGGTFEITQSVIANGGGTSADATYAVEGTIAQHAAGSISSSGPYGFRAGFWYPLSVPTAAGVSVSGRVVTPDGRGLRNAAVSMTDSNGAKRTITTSSFGYFTFDNVGAGQTYILGVRDKRFRFAALAINVFDAIADLYLIGLE